jgi:hypothetical protein
MRRYYHTHASERGPVDVTDRGALVGLLCAAVVVGGLLAVTAPVAMGWAVAGGVAALAARRVVLAVGRRDGRTPARAVRATVVAER